VPSGGPRTRPRGERSAGNRTGASGWGTTTERWTACGWTSSASGWPPDVVATFGPDGIFGHPDHIAIGAATDAAFHRLAPRAERGFRRLCHGAIPESVFSRWNTQRAAMDLFAFDPTRTYHMRGVPDEQIGITVDCRPVADRIVAGLAEHRSQHHVMSDDPSDTERWKRVVSREWWVVAWPERPAGAPMLADVFEGLD
jgi:LmbE family N-acetylglucosaminyl deacetylase